MARDPRYDCLFEPIRIGPKVARNRFYQTAHCNGMGRLRPRGQARMRGIKAEGGWAVVNTEHCGIHPNAEMFPETVLTLWDDADIPVLALMCDAVHEHGALAASGIESVTRIGDCLAPGAIVHATFAGHRYARELDTAPEERLFRHELPAP